ncbi:hypothetical protein INR49_031145 [Caranx melampygus]|nr:hypothetical protein INR49_031145 [Caranx melampygus]
MTSVPLDAEGLGSEIPHQALAIGPDLPRLSFVSNIISSYRSITVLHVQICFIQTAHESVHLQDSQQHWEPQCSSNRMGLLLLLTSMLLSCYFHPGFAADTVPSFVITAIFLSVEPGGDVARGTNVTLKCSAKVSISGSGVVSCKYTIYKGYNQIHTKNSSTSEDLLYMLPDTRVSDTGTYWCKINIKDKELSSKTETLTVTGIEKPVLRLNKHVAGEKEEVTASCSAPGEKGKIDFYFFDNNSQHFPKQEDSLKPYAKFRFSRVGTHVIHCTYTVALNGGTLRSENSNSINVTVRELFPPPVLKIDPHSNIYEGDHLNILCTTSSHVGSSREVHLDLSHGTKLLDWGSTKVNHSMIILAKDTQGFECRQKIDEVVKTTTKNISVTELFSAPALTMSPAEVFQGESMTISCRSQNVAYERIKVEDLIYNLEPQDNSLSGGSEFPRRGVFSGKAPFMEFNYTCVAQAKGIMKHSQTLTVRPKVSVSHPKISVEGEAILGRPIKIHCHSDNGSLPINYTLIKHNDILSTKTIRLPTEKALFTVTINSPEEINSFMCEAENNQKQHVRSDTLITDVIEPLSQTTLTVIPTLSDISEGEDLYLICGTKGTPPVTFYLYRVGIKPPLFTNISQQNNTNFLVPNLSKQHSGTYYLHLALWKKALIVGVVSSEPDVEYTEVVHPQPADDARVPLRKGTDTVYSELKNLPHGAAGHHDYGSVEYAELNGDRPETGHHLPEVNNYQDLPVPVD